jgi:hypothetical protein
MRARGVEPPRAEAHRDLNPARLPVPPRPRTGGRDGNDGDRTHRRAPAALPWGRAPVAQGTERRPSKPMVGGSNPPGRVASGRGLVVRPRRRGRSSHGEATFRAGALQSPRDTASVLPDVGAARRIRPAAPSEAPDGRAPEEALSHLARQSVDRGHRTAGPGSGLGYPPTRRSGRVVSAGGRRMR